MDTNTIAPATDAGIGNLQRIHPSANSGRRRQGNPRRRPAQKTPPPSRETTYTPDGHVETEEHGLRVDICA